MCTGNRCALGRPCTTNRSHTVTVPSRCNKVLLHVVPPRHPPNILSKSQRPNISVTMESRNVDPFVRHPTVRYSNLNAARGLAVGIDSPRSRLKLGYRSALHQAGIKVAVQGIAIAGPVEPKVSDLMDHKRHGQWRGPCSRYSTELRARSTRQTGIKVPVPRKALEYWL